MTTPKDELTQKLFEIYPRLPMAFWTEFSEFCNSYPESRLMDIFNHLRNNPSGDKLMIIYGTPKIEQFTRAAKALGVKPKKVNIYTASVCTVCDTTFDSQSRGCPVCKKITPIKAKVEHFPFDYIRLQEYCYNCDYGLDYRKEKGPGCAAYGTGSVIPDCDGCKCSECCAFEARLRQESEDRWEYGKFNPGLLDSKESSEQEDT